MRIELPPSSAPGAPEQVWRVVVDGPLGAGLRIAANVELEVWRDDGAGGHFAGDGGHRCVEGEALADEWPELAGASRVVVLARVIDPERTECLHRRLPRDAFVVIESLASGATLPPVRVQPATHLSFRAKCSAQLPRQCVVTGRPSETEPALDLGAGAALNGVIASPLRRARYVEAVPRRIAQRAPIDVVGGQPWQPHEADDVGGYVRAHAASATLESYDLGAIGLYRFEIDAPPDSAVAVIVSEVAGFDDVWATRSRSKVSLAAAAAAGVRGAAPFGVLGGRTLHVLRGGVGAAPVVRAWRREYPLELRTVDVEPGCEAIVEACRNNLRACVDGGVVDTCWRERAQWTGDMRMSCAALRALCDNPEVIALALSQIAASYDDARGMVQGVAPVHNRTHDLYIPGFHLAFCLAVLDDDPTLVRHPRAGEVVRRSVERWRALHVRDGLVQGMRGWAFTDWDPLDKRHEGVDVPSDVPHAVVNAWWIELCARLGVPSGVDDARFAEAFRRRDGYGLLAGDERSSLHASAAVASSGAGDLEHALAHLDGARAELPRRMTPYFATFAARALARRARADALDLVRALYGPMAARLGTLVERTNDDYSLAHGWSVGIAELCVRDRS